VSIDTRPGDDAGPRIPPPVVRFVARRRGEPGDGAGTGLLPGAVAQHPPGSAPILVGSTTRVLSDEHRDRFGMLAPLVEDARVTDVFVNGTSGAWADTGSGLARVPTIAPGEEELRDLVVRLVALGGRHIDETNPCVDTRLGSGIRVHAVLPPISTSGTLLSVRLPSVEAPTLDWLEQREFFSAVPRTVVAGLVARRENVLISGAAGSGKTTLLSAMLGAAARTERIIAIEDVAELRVDHPHFLALEARQANLEGAGSIGLERLVREALRMRPDRLVLGECRGAEIRDLLTVLNTGHDGGAGTLHANSLADVPARLEALGALAGMPAEAVARQTVSAIGAVLHLERTGSRRGIAELGRFALDARGRLTVSAENTAPRRPGAHAAIPGEDR
jgi:pilus assembly protein CpaF